mgnify:FL=1
MMNTISGSADVELPDVREAAGQQITGETPKPVMFYFTSKYTNVENLQLN